MTGLALEYVEETDGGRAVRRAHHLVSVSQELDDLIRCGRGFIVSNALASVAVGDVVSLRVMLPGGFHPGDGHRVVVQRVTGPDVMPGLMPGFLLIEIAPITDGTWGLRGFMADDPRQLPMFPGLGVM